MTNVWGQESEGSGRNNGNGNGNDNSNDNRNSNDNSNSNDNDNSNDNRRSPSGMTTKKIGNGNSRSLRATTERTGNRNYDSDCNCGDNSEAKTGILRCAQDDDC